MTRQQPHRVNPSRRRRARTPSAPAKGCLSVTIMFGLLYVAALAAGLL